ncbi:MAG: 4-hydroxythreonine-4-phosphate dehydrogenase PdxA [Magnetococcales bacterium]|nr:4-hydroxythreonine-4-phosphate dehydrogenase PdxA [Magnetococcales bacterium]
MGDPAGVGPEVLIKAHAGRSCSAPWLWIGDPDLLPWTASRLDLDLNFQVVTTPEEACQLPPECLAVLPAAHSLALATLTFGQPNPRHAPAVVASIQKAVELALAGRVAAVVTPPIHKAVLFEAGFDYPGHTEMLGHFTHTPHPVMMLAGEGLRVVPATIHQSLKSVPHALTREALFRVMETTLTALQRDFAMPSPRLAVAGLNPHAGEEGAFGREEIEVIRPVCEALAEKYPGTIRGPLPADTLFHAAARSSYDAVICMYHDQALIPLKMLAFGQAANITLGLPIVRTSVDHGTAFDIAGKGLADPRSLHHAVDLASRISKNRLMIDK